MKKLITIIILLALAGCTTNTQLGAGKKVEVEKLKAHKSKILKSEDIEECTEWKDSELKIDCLKTQKVKKYHYISDKKVEKQTLKYKAKDSKSEVLLEEDLNKRTGNSVHFKIKKDSKLLGASEEQEDEYVAKFYLGTPFVLDDGEWYQTETATTTIDNYEIETATTTEEMLGASGDPVYSTADAGTYYSAGSNPAGASWDSYRAGSGSGIQTSASNAYFCLLEASSATDKWRVMYRSQFPFDTSSIGSGSTITSATFKLYGLGKNNVLGVLTAINIYNTTGTFTTLVDKSDHQLVGDTEYSTRITYANWDVGYNSFALNSSGLSAISKTGYTRFSTREAIHDGDDSEPTWSGSGYTGMYGHHSTQIGTDKDPYLEVAYTTGGTERRFYMIEDN